MSGYRNIGGGAAASTTDLTLPDSLDIGDSFVLTVGDLAVSEVAEADALVTVRMTLGDSEALADSLLVLSGDVIFASTADLSEVLTANVALPTDTLAVADGLDPTAKLLESTAVADAVARVKPLLKDTAGFGESAISPKVSTSVYTGGDNWTDAASTGTNNGSATQMRFKVNTSPIGDNTRYAFMKWDLTGVAGFVARPGSSPRVDIFNARHLGAAGGQGAELSIRTGSSNPFTESTQNWSNQNVNYGTSVVEDVWHTEFTSTPQDISYVMTPANVNSILGQWVQIRAFQPSALAINEHAFDSKEGGTAPRLVLFLDLS